MTRQHGFERISQFSDEAYNDLNPKRETSHAAGYDLKVAESTTINPGDIALIPTGVKAYMQPGEVLFLFDRSSNPNKKGSCLSTQSVLLTVITTTTRLMKGISSRK